jgi:hypothetical protein
MDHRSVALLLLSLVTACSAAASHSDTARNGPGPAHLVLTEEETACALSDHDTRWIQQALDGWERVSRDFLEIEPLPLPWLVLFNRSCAWHLNPEESKVPDARPVRLGLTFAGELAKVRVERHDSAVYLPSGSRMPVQGVAFASLYEREPGGRAPFFVLSLLDVWREKFAQDPHVDTEMLGVFSHEIVHTRQLGHVARRVEELKGRYTFPERLSDDAVEERFEEVPGFREAHEAETDLLYRAVSEPDPVRKRALVAEALELTRARQAEYFTGPNAVYRELEELFLNMEGVAVWAAYKLSQADSAFDIGIEDPTTDRRRNTWSQDQGFALFLLIEELVPNWRKRVLGPEVASPFRLLEEAVGPRR